jgi:hypothetical protein
MNKPVTTIHEVPQELLPESTLIYELDPRQNPVRDEFEQWYVLNVFDLKRDPIGSELCARQWKAWKAARAMYAKGHPRDEGGEAVAWRVDYGTGKNHLYRIFTDHSDACDLIDQLVAIDYKLTPLYTHPPTSAVTEQLLRDSRDLLTWARGEGWTIGQERQADAHIAALSAALERK